MEKKPFKNVITSSQMNMAFQRPRSAKALNNGIPIFTHERAEERATKKQQTVSFFFSFNIYKISR